MEFMLPFFMSTSNVKKKKVTLLVFSSIFVVLGSLCLIFFNWTTELMKHVTFAFFLNTTSAQYIIMGLAGLFLILGVVLGVLGLKVKFEES